VARLSTQLRAVRTTLSFFSIKPCWPHGAVGGETFTCLPVWDVSRRRPQVLEHDGGREEMQAMAAGWHRLDFDFIDEKTAIYGRFRNIAMACTCAACPASRCAFRPLDPCYFV
jgi:hypothetical protein